MRTNFHPTLTFSGLTMRKSVISFLTMISLASARTVHHKLWSRIPVNSGRTFAYSSGTIIFQYVMDQTLERACSDDLNSDSQCIARFSCTPFAKYGGLRSFVQKSIEITSLPIGSKLSFSFPGNSSTYAYCLFELVSLPSEDTLLVEDASCQECMTKGNDFDGVVMSFRTGPFQPVNEIVWNACGSTGASSCLPCRKNEVEVHGSYRLLYLSPSVGIAMSIPGVWECEDSVACMTPPLCMPILPNQTYALSLNVVSFRIVDPTNDFLELPGMFQIQSTPFSLSTEDIERFNMTGSGSKTWCFVYNDVSRSVMLLEEDCKADVAPMQRPSVVWFTVVFITPVVIGMLLTIVSRCTSAWSGKANVT